MVLDHQSIEGMINMMDSHMRNDPSFLHAVCEGWLLCGIRTCVREIISPDPFWPFKPSENEDERGDNNTILSESGSETFSRSSNSFFLFFFGDGNSVMKLFMQLFSFLIKCLHEIVNLGFCRENFGGSGRHGCGHFRVGGLGKMLSFL